MAKIIKKADRSTDYLFVPGKITMLLDGYSAGSSGKGKLESYIVRNCNNDIKSLNFVVTTNSANASHIVWDNGREMMFKCLPSSAYLHEKLDAVYLTQGSAFEVSTLLKEIEMCGIPREKVRIHPKAGIIGKIDIDYESGLCDLDGNYYASRQDGTIKSGTTASGSGAVRAKKCLRHKTLVFAGDVDELKDMICETDMEILDRLSRGESGLGQIGQGLPLSYGLAQTGRHSTARNVTVSAFLDDTMLPPSVVGNVIINGRTFPIKIANYKNVSVGGIVYKDKLSCKPVDEDYPARLFTVINDMDNNCWTVMTNPDVFVTGNDLDRFPDYPINKIESYSGDFWEDQEQITWAEVEQLYGKPIDTAVKRTSLTLLERRIATFSKGLLHRAIKYSMPPEPYKIYVSLNFVNWLDGSLDDVTDYITDQAKDWIDSNVNEVINQYDRVKLAFLGTGKESESMIQLMTED